MGERIVYTAELAHMPLVYMLDSNPNSGVQAFGFADKQGRLRWVNPHAQHKGLAFKGTGF